MKNFSSHLCAGRILFFIPASQQPPFTLPSHFANIFSRLVRTDSTVDINDSLQNPFAHFASTKFNISAADIARMFRSAPNLQRLQTLDKVEQFIGMLNKHGFKQDQIAMIMRRHPGLVTMNAETLIEPKLRLLKHSGFDQETLVNVLTSRPRILTNSLERELLPKLTLLKNVFQSQDLLIKALSRSASVLTYNMEKTLKPSLAFWEGCGFRGMELAKFLCTTPSLLRCSSLTPAQVHLIDKIGIERGSGRYRHILALVAYSRMETLEAKIHNFQLCGLSTGETMDLFRARPFVFHFSPERVRQNMEFLVYTLELPANSVLKHGTFLELNLEKVKPRVLVLQEMKSMNRLGHLELKQVCTILKMPEAKFLSKIVQEHPESSTLYEIYGRAIVDASGHTKPLRKAYYF